MAKINLDLTNVIAESSSMFSKVPAGNYTVSLAHAQFKDNGTSAGVQLGYMVESGEHKGKLIPDYINIVNQNEKAVEIGLQRLRRICDLQLRKSFKIVNDTDLINRTQFSIEVDLVEGEYQGKPVENVRVKKLLAIDSSKTIEKEKVEKEVNITTDKLPWE